MTVLQRAVDRLNCVKREFGGSDDVSESLNAQSPEDIRLRALEALLRSRGISHEEATAIIHCAATVGQLAEDNKELLGNIAQCNGSNWLDGFLHGVTFEQIRNAEDE